MPRCPAIFAPTMRSVFTMLALCAALVLALAGLSRRRRRRARQEFARILRAAADGTLARFEWYDFLAADLADPDLQEIRSYVADLPTRYPPEGRNRFCGPEGIEILEHYLSRLERGRISKASRSTTGR